MTPIIALLSICLLCALVVYCVLAYGARGGGEEERPGGEQDTDRPHANGYHSPAVEPVVIRQGVEIDDKPDT